MLESEASILTGEEGHRSPQGSTCVIPRGILHDFRNESAAPWVSLTVGNLHGSPAFYEAALCPLRIERRKAYLDEVGAPSHGAFVLGHDGCNVEAVHPGS